MQSTDSTTTEKYRTHASPLPDGWAPEIFTLVSPSPRIGGDVRNVLFIASTLARSPNILRIPEVILLAVKWPEPESSYTFLSTKVFKNVQMLTYIIYASYHGEISRFLQLINFYNITRTNRLAKGWKVRASKPG